MLVITYKGFTGIKKNNAWEFTSYANPTFVGNNKAKIKTAINQYLNDINYLDYLETYVIS